MDIALVAKTTLFHGLTEEGTAQALQCLAAVQRTYAKGELILAQGTVLRQIGLVLSGSVHIEQGDVWGNQNLLARITAGQVFGETYACIGDEPMTVSVTAADMTQILWIDVDRLLADDPSSCPCHSRLVRNLLSVFASRNLDLTRKIHHITPKTIRERLLAYLSLEAVRHKSMTFDIPFDRQQLADYLSVERSALSNELSKMRRDGLLEVRKNHFELRQAVEE